MILLDMHTVTLLSIVIYSICTILIAQLWRQNSRRFTGIAFWIFNFALQTTAIALIAMRGAIPDWLSIVLANTLMFAGALLGYMGLERFVEKVGTQLHNYLLFALYAGAFVYFTFIHPDLHMRTLIGSVGLLIISFQCLWLLWHRVDPDTRPMTFGVGMVFGGYCLVSIVRISVYFAGVPLGEDYFHSDVSQALVLVAYQMLFILLTYSLSLMVNKRLYLAIRSQEEKFAKAFHSAPYAITLTRLSDGRMVDVNENFVAITGYDRVEAIGEKTMDLRLWEHPEDRAAVIDALSRNGKVSGVELQFRKKNGGAVTGLFSAELITIDGEKNILSSISDITRRKRAEQEMTAIAEIGRVIGASLNIEEVYERFAAETRKLIPFDSLIVNLKTSPADTLEVAYTSGIPIPNRRVGDRFPLRGSIAEVIMRTRAGLIVQAMSAEEMVARFPTIAGSVQAGMRSMMGVPLLSKDEMIGALMIRSKKPGSYTEQDLRLAEKIGDQIAGAMANAQLFTDLQKTERSLRESEEKYRELVEFLPISVFEIGPDGRIASFNHTALEMFRYAAEDPIHDMAGCQLIAPGERERLEQDMQAVLDGASKSSIAYKFIRKDGSLFTGLIYASPIIRQGEPAGIRGAIIDVTDRIKALEELQKAKDHLLQSEKLVAVGRLAAGVAHEILNPVNIISLTMQMLMKGGELAPKARQELTVCLEQIHRIVSIADGLKQFSRIQGSRLAMGDIAVAVNHVLTLCLPQLKMNGIQTDVRYPGDLPMTLMDRERIEQVILNLITNAAAAMEGKEEKVLRITIGRGTATGKKDCLRVTIADTGTGISKQSMTKLFEPFFTTKEPGQGTGLGLSISFGIIQDHGGQIWAENNEWGGASFFFEIPITAGEDGTVSKQRR
jgi:PAS domain S-box-containing protein